MIHTDRHIQIGMQTVTGRQVDRQTDQTDTQTDRRAGRQINIL